MLGRRLVSELQMNINSSKNTLSHQVSTYNKFMNNVPNMQIRTCNKIIYIKHNMWTGKACAPQAK